MLSVKFRPLIRRVPDKSVSAKEPVGAAPPVNPLKAGLVKLALIEGPINVPLPVAVLIVSTSPLVWLYVKMAAAAGDARANIDAAIANATAFVCVVFVTGFPSIFGLQIVNTVSSSLLRRAVSS